MARYALEIDVNSGESTDKPKRPRKTEEQKEEEKREAAAKRASARVKQVAVLGFTTAMGIASKSAGYAGDYVRQQKINNAMAAVGIAGALTASVGMLMKGNIAGGVLGLATTGAAVGFSIWDYHENIRTQNLQASYLATYRGARMNSGRI